MSAAFSYEVDLDALDRSGLHAVNNALDGDLAGLEGASLNGVKRLNSVFSGLRQGKEILKVNVLGIFNAGSVTTLLQEGTLIVDAGSGDITITDRAAARRIQFTSSNFVKNTNQLRHVLAESFLITAAYRASGTVRAGPGLTSKLWFFALRQKADLENIRDYLNVSRALRLMSVDRVRAELQSVTGVSEFGQSTFYAYSDYQDAALKNLFIGPEGEPRDEAEYEAIGRKALALLVHADDPVNDARRLPLTNDEKWKAMKTAGQTNNFGGVFADCNFNANQFADIASDYTLVTWWASAMHRMSAALADLLKYTTTHPVWDPENNTFKKLRQALDGAMTAVADNTKDQFAEPWGLIAMDLAANGKAATGVRLVCSQICLAILNSPARASSIAT